MTKKMKKKLIFILVALVLFIGALLCPAVLQEELPILQTILFVLAYLLVGFEVLKTFLHPCLKFSIPSNKTLKNLRCTSFSVGSEYGALPPEESMPTKAHQSLARPAELLTGHPLRCSWHSRGQ